MYLTSISLLAVAPVIPAKVYDNADTQKGSIIDDNRGKAGIYRWVNKENGNSYIGSAENLTNRFYQYFNLKCISRGNMLINKALLKYGY